MAKRLPRRLGGRSRGDLKRAHSQHWACEATECGEGGGHGLALAECQWVQVGYQGPAGSAGYSLGLCVVSLF